MTAKTKLPIYKPFTNKSMQARIKVLNDIPRERSRQEHLHPGELDLSLQLAVIMEEVGELAQALQAHYKLASVKNTDKTNLYDEAIQVSASAARLAEHVLLITSKE